MALARISSSVNGAPQTPLAVAVLGPFVVSVGGAPVVVTGAKRAAVLALLAKAGPGGLVPADTLVDAIWPESPPGSGRAALQSHVSRLRRDLGRGAPRLEHAAGGYRLRLEEGDLDAAVFEQLFRSARACASPDPARAHLLLVDARALWRGAPLAELASVEPLASWARALTESWLDASDLLARCALDLDDPSHAVAVASESLDAEPLREASLLLLVEAMAAQRREAEALRTAHAFRARLRNQTGLDPSPALANLERDIALGTARHSGPAAARQSPAAARQSPTPTASGTLFGREGELVGVSRLVTSERLVSLVGPGGVGKTRLAQEVLRRTPIGATPIVLHLATVTDADALADVLAVALGLGSGRGDPLERSLYLLRRGPHVLLADNCEHLLAPVRSLVKILLDACPDLTVMATSRERLALPVEQVVRLAPLPMPSAGTGSPDVASVALFLDRARRSRPDLAVGAGELATIGRIVRALDGLPLAIELAAGRLASVQLRDLEERLDRSLDLLAHPAGERAPDGRHRTLRATIQWSYDLLPEQERRLFRHLAVFPGGVDLKTVEWVAGELSLAVDPAVAIGHLVERSVVIADFEGLARYRMLDSLRRFGLDLLAAEGETQQAVDRLLRWAVRVCKDVDDVYDTPAEATADELMKAEMSNLRAAWHATRDSANLDAAASMTVHLYSYAVWREVTELFRWFLEVAADPRLPRHPLAAPVLGVASEATWLATGDLDRAEELALLAVAAVRPGDPGGSSMARWALADVHLFRGRYAEAGRLALESREGTRWVSEGAAQAALAAVYAGDLAGARRLHERGCREVGGPTLRAYLQYVGGEIANAAGELEAARRAYVDAVEAARGVGATFLAGIASVGLVSVQAVMGDTGEALRGFEDVIGLWERSGAWTQQWTTLRNLADLLERAGDNETAQALREAAAHAPEASAVTGAGVAGPGATRTGGLDREAALVLARAAIGRVRAAMSGDRPGIPT